MGPSLRKGIGGLFYFHSGDVARSTIAAISFHMAMWAEPASRYWVIRLPAEIAGHLIIRAHVQNISLGLSIFVEPPRHQSYSFLGALNESDFKKDCGVGRRSQSFLFCH